MSAAAHLRIATQPLHDRVDAAFGGFALDDAAGYCHFLLAHALALPAVEAALADLAGLPAWRPRTALLAADLADLGAAMPPPLGFDLPPGEAAAWGALYVIEGSRLGGAMLAKTVPARCPTRYLAAVHLPGEWRAFRAALDEAGATGGNAWLVDARHAAAVAFKLYRRAAGSPGVRLPESS